MVTKSVTQGHPRSPKVTQGHPRSPSRSGVRGEEASLGGALPPGAHANGTRKDIAQAKTDPFLLGLPFHPLILRRPASKPPHQRKVRQSQTRCYISSHRQSSILNRKSLPFDVGRSTFNVQRSTFNVQRSTFNVQRSTFNVQRSTFDVPYPSSSPISHLPSPIFQLSAFLPKCPPRLPTPICHLRHRSR